MTKTHRNLLTFALAALVSGCVSYAMAECPDGPPPPEKSCKDAPAMPEFKAPECTCPKCGEKFPLAPPPGFEPGKFPSGPPMMGHFPPGPPRGDFKPGEGFRGPRPDFKKDGKPGCCDKEDCKCDKKGPEFKKGERPQGPPPGFRGEGPRGPRPDMKKDDKRGEGRGPRGPRPEGPPPEAE